MSGASSQPSKESDFKFRRYPSERLWIDSIRSRLSDTEQFVRMRIMDWIIAAGSPVGPISLWSPAELKGLETAAVVQNLISKHVIVANEKAEIVFAYPVSAFPTNHKVRLSDGKVFFAMCAVDALGAAFTFNQDSTVDSVCSRCGKPVHAGVRSGKISESTSQDIHVLHADLKINDNWAVTC